MPHLSVSTVVPTFDRASLPEPALRNALLQCEPADEVIVVDDGSTDDTEADVLPFGPHVGYLRTPHLGAGAARSAGVRAEYEAVMDAHRARRVRHLLGRGRSGEARREFAMFFHAAPRPCHVLAFVPGSLTGYAGFRRSFYSLGDRQVS